MNCFGIDSEPFRLTRVFFPLVCWLVLALSNRPAPCAEIGLITEHQFRAACLYNFAQFIDWPKDIFPDADTPVTLGILGQDFFGADLELVIGDRKAKGRKVRIRRFNDVQGARSCQILFIPATEEKRLREVLEAVKGLSVVTVGETVPFTRAGGMIGLPLERGKVRIEINMDAADQARLTVSSRLLKVSTILRPSQAERKK